MVRQLGSPEIFFTKSVNEMGMYDMIQSLLEKETCCIATIEEARNLSNKEKMTLIKNYPIDVVHYVDARFRHHIATFKKTCSLGEYRVEDFFYRVEFQQRGSAHIHCLFWLVDQQGQRPPQLDYYHTQNDANFFTIF